MASEELPMTGSRVILRRESNMCHSTNMIPAPWTSSVEFPRVPYWDHYYSLYMSMISPMFHLYYLHYCLQMIPMSLSPGKIYQLYLQRWIVNLSDCRNGWMSTNSLLMWKRPSICYFAQKKQCDIKWCSIELWNYRKVEHFKFLGVHIDSKLNWSYHCACANCTSTHFHCSWIIELLWNLREILRHTDFTNCGYNIQGLGGVSNWTVSAVYFCDCLWFYLTIFISHSSSVQWDLGITVSALQQLWNPMGNV